MSGFFQVVHTLQLHVFAHFIEFLDQFSIGRDSQVFAFLEQQLLIDQIAENVLLTFSIRLVGVGGILLLRLLLQLFLAALIFSTGDDLIIHPRNDLLDHSVGGDGERHGNETKQQIRENFPHRNSGAIPK